MRRCLLIVFASYSLCFGGDSIAIVTQSRPGGYSVDEWKRDWPGCAFEDGVREGRVSIVANRGQLAWRVAFAQGQIGPEKGGAGWRWPFTKEVTQQAELLYTVLFEDGFDFVKGGKLPGLCGGPKTITGGDRCTGFDGWSVRLMWRREGRGQAYVYHPNMPEQYGDEFDFPDDFRFPVGSPVRIRMVVGMNSPGKRDGKLRVWTTLPNEKERLAVDRDAMEWTKTSKIGVDSLLINTFFGGSDSSWAPKRKSAIQFSDISYAVE